MREIVSLEALIRWNKNGKIINPDKFLGIAEETGLINDIGLSTLDQLGNDYKALNKHNKSNIKLSFNISVRQFQDDEFMNSLKRKVASYKIPPKAIILEMTESIFLDAGMDNIKKLNGLRSDGFQVVFDDFGTGYSSLSYLRQIPVDYIKLDKSFIDELDKDPDSIDFIQAIVQLAHTIKLPVVAEGVEKKAMANILEKAGCDMLQGYYFSKPVRLEKILENHFPEIFLIEQVRLLSYYNPLTNLPNRDYLGKELEQVIEKSKSSKTSFSIMLVDLNRFRRIIESMGKGASDHLLKIISGRLHDTLRDSDILGHIGPDEFVLILDKIDYLDSIQALVERIIKEVEKPIHYNKREKNKCVCSLIIIH